MRRTRAQSSGPDAAAWIASVRRSEGGHIAQAAARRNSGEKSGGIKDRRTPGGSWKVAAAGISSHLNACGSSQRVLHQSLCIVSWTIASPIKMARVLMIQWVSDVVQTLRFRWAVFFWTRCLAGLPWYWPARPLGARAMVDARRM